MSDQAPEVATKPGDGTEKRDPAFASGDRVCWDHAFSTQHATGSIIRESAVPDTGEVGTVVDVANEEGTWFEVDFDGRDDNVVLTADELVKVALGE